MNLIVTLFFVFFVESVTFSVIKGSRRNQQQRSLEQMHHLSSVSSSSSALYSDPYYSTSNGKKKDNGDTRRRKPTPPLKEKKPNIVMILTDDQDIELVSMWWKKGAIKSNLSRNSAGSPRLSTTRPITHASKTAGSMNFMPKTLRILGDGGAHFSNAYVTTPMCCPSRSSMLTGLYVHNHQVHTNNDNCSSPWWQQEHETKTFATYLNNAGYRTAYFGKYLNEYNGSYIPPGWREWVALIRNSRFYNYSINVNGNKIRHGDNYFRDYYPDLIANDSINFLRRSKRHFVNKPVMMVLSFPSPHGPEDAAPHYQHLFHNVTTHRTPSWNFAPNPDKQWLLRNTGKMEPIHVKFTDVLHTKRLQTLQTVDEAVERLYRELRLLGELENTYIFYTSDHGYHLGQFGLVKGKSMPFEFDVRVPFFVRGPRVPRGVRIQDIVLNIDLAPTFLDIAGVDIPEHMDGRSILSLLKDADMWASSGHRHTEVRRKKSWRDSFLIERGVVNSSRKGYRQMLAQSSPSLSKLTKDQRLASECQKPDYSSPCQYYQKWECVHDGFRWRIQKCRNYIIAPDHNNCVCPDDDEEDPFNFDIEEFRIKSESKLSPQTRKRKHMDSLTRQEKQLFSGAIDSELLPKFPGRWKRYIDLDPEEDFDIESVEQLFSLLDATIGNRTHEDTSHLINFETTTEDVPNLHNTAQMFTQSPVPFEDRGKRETPASFQLGIHNECIVLPNGTRNCIDTSKYQHPVSWKEKKEKLDTVIKRLRQKLEKLKGYRKHLKKTRPSYVTKNYFGPDVFEEDEYNKPCVCGSKDNMGFRQQLKEDRRQRREDLRRQRQIRREEYARKMERKIRRKTKFENMTCNAEKMNCFTQDNDHWKTPPLWADGPFCFCQNSNNNTFWCLRTINETHNFLYCEFVTGFITFYDLRTDPYQMRNAIHDLDFHSLEALRMQLNRLRSCKGAKECTVKYKSEVTRHHHHNQKESPMSTAHSARHWKNSQRLTSHWGSKKQQERQQRWQS